MFFLMKALMLSPSLSPQRGHFSNWNLSPILIVQADYLFSEIKSRGGEPFALNVQIVLDCIGEMHHFWTFNFKQINPKA
jgi:hypothetical protein